MTLTPTQDVQVFVFEPAWLCFDSLVEDLSLCVYKYFLPLAAVVAWGSMYSMHGRLQMFSSQSKCTSADDAWPAQPQHLVCIFSLFVEDRAWPR